MPDSYSIQDVDSFFKARLQDEARRIFATGALTRIYENAVSKIPEIKFTIVGGARAYPRLGRVADYKKLRAEKTVKVPFGGNGEKVVELRWDAPQTEKYLSPEDYRAVEAEILRFFSQQHTHSDYDLAAVVVDNETKREADVIPRIIDEIKATCENPGFKADVEEARSGLGVSSQDLFNKESLARIFDVRQDFVYKEKDFIDQLRTYIQIFQTFRSDVDDVAEVVSVKEEKNTVVVRLKQRIEARVANVRIEKGAIVVLVEPRNSPPPYLQETLERGALIVGKPLSEPKAVLKEVGDLIPTNKGRLRGLPEGWQAFVDYAIELDEYGLLTNGLAPFGAKYEGMLSSSV